MKSVAGLLTMNDDGARSGVRVVRISSGFEADKISLYVPLLVSEEWALFVVDVQLKGPRAGGVDGQEKLEKKKTKRMDG